MEGINGKRGDPVTRFVKWMPGNSIVFASRNKREIAAVLELGWEASVVCRDQAPVSIPGLPCQFVSDGFTKLTYAVPRLKRYRIILRDRARLGRTLRDMAPDVMSCHDLPALRMAWWYSRFLPRVKRPLLVYDSHEFELGRNAKRTKLQALYVRWQEGFLMRRCAFSIMVNDSIADEVQCIHRLQARPVVVRSTPENWQLDPVVIARQRRAFCESLGVGEDTFLVMYHGGIMPARGIENMLRAVARTRDTAAVVLGNGSDEAYVAGLHALCGELGVTDRVLFCPAVPIEVLWEYVGAADAGTVLLEPVVKNHYYTLPNKFFENIQALTPVIVSDFPEVGGLTKRYGIGLAADPEDVGAIVAAIERMRDDKAFYAQCKANLAKAKEELCWEKEKEALQAAYAALYAQLERIRGK